MAREPPSPRGATEYKNPSNTQKIRKKLQNPPFRVGPQKYRKNTEKLRKWPFSDRFCDFLVFFVLSGLSPEGGRGDCVNFPYFLYFRLEVSKNHGASENGLIPIETQGMSKHDFQARFQGVKVYVFGGLPVGNPTEKTRASKHF